MIPTLKPEGFKRLLDISDIHLFNNNTPVTHIMDTLDKHVFNPKVLVEVDAVAISGDLFDKWVKLVNGGIFFEWTQRALQVLKDTNTVLRILEGTPSHDWKQAQFIVDINTHTGINADIHYITELSIVDDPILGIVAYIPDECRSSPEKILSDLKEMMTTRGISQVDFIIAHGFFDFQLPPNQTSGMDSKAMSDMTKHLIICGHDHRRKAHLKVRVPGSWDRIAHGEEGDKGGIVIDFNDKECREYFLKNPDALPYVKFSYLDMSDEEILQRIDSDLDSVPKGYIRFELNDDTTLKGYISDLIKKEKANLDVVYKSTKVDELEDVVFKLEGATLHVTPDNIANVILDELVEDTDVDRLVLLAEIEVIKAAA